MKNLSVKHFIRTLLVVCAPVVLLSGCANLNDPYGGNYGGNYGGGYGGYGGYNPPPQQPYYGGGYPPPGYYGGPGYYNNPNYRQERRDLERERRQLEEERRRLEQERNRPLPTPVPSIPLQTTCPPGFTPSEQKCSPAERRRGCRDVRLNSGLGCVSR